MRLILLIEDSQSLREQLKITIENIYTRVEVAEAESLSAAYGLIEKRDFEMCITDSVVNQTESLKFISRLKKENDKVRIIIFSKNNHTIIKERFLKAGADYFFHKIYELHPFLEQLRVELS